jgi:hypothetical protein
LNPRTIPIAGRNRAAAGVMSLEPARGRASGRQTGEARAIGAGHRPRHLEGAPTSSAYTASAGTHGASAGARTARSDGEGERRRGRAGESEPFGVSSGFRAQGSKQGRALLSGRTWLHPDGRACRLFEPGVAPHTGRAATARGRGKARQRLGAGRRCQCRRSRAARGAVDRLLAQWDSGGVATLGEQRGSWTRSLLRRLDEAQVAGHVDGARFCPLRPARPAQFL